ncbi:hypothetical protein D3C73_1465890 [compost metagenome]
MSATPLAPAVYLASAVKRSWLVKTLVSYPAVAAEAFVMCVFDSVTVLAVLQPARLVSMLKYAWPDIRKALFGPAFSSAQMPMVPKSSVWVVLSPE